MIDVLYKKMAIPESCYLGKRVFKRLFLENIKLNSTDKKAFKEDIDTIIWQYALKPLTIQIQPYEDNEREYLEVAVLEINFNNSKRYERVAKVIHRAIPYPLVLILSDEKNCALSLATKRFSQAEKGAIVVEEFFTTSWMNLASPTQMQEHFLESLAIPGLPNTHFFAFYSALVERFVALDCARFSGKFRLNSEADKQQLRKNILGECHKLQLQISEIRLRIKKETQFNRKVELNSKIKELEQKLNDEVKVL